MFYIVSIVVIVASVHVSIYTSSVCVCVHLSYSCLFVPSKR